MKFLSVLTALILYAHSGSANAQGACSLIISKNVPTTYTSCRALYASTGAIFAWSFSNETYVLNATIHEQPEQAGGWTAWGINEDNAPSMSPGNVIACYPDQSGTAIVKQFHLSGYSESGVRPGNKLNFTTTACTIDTSTNPPTNYMQFSLQLNQSYTAFSQNYGKGPGVDFSQPNILLRHNPTDNFGQQITITTGLVSEKSSTPRKSSKCVSAARFDLSQTSDSRLVKCGQFIVQVHTKHKLVHIIRNVVTAVCRLWMLLIYVRA